MYLALYHKKKQLTKSVSTYCITYAFYSIIYIYFFLFDSKQFPSVMYSILVYNGEVRISVYFETSARNWYMKARYARIEIVGECTAKEYYVNPSNNEVFTSMY